MKRAEQYVKEYKEVGFGERDNEFRLNEKR